MEDQFIIPQTGSREERYRSLIPQLNALIGGERDLIANLANTAAVLHRTFGFFWTGFYLVKEHELVLAPFQGPVACTRILFGRGVCGAAWEAARTIIVPDVEKFPGHIACNAESKSEIVVPLLSDGVVIGVLDIDADRRNVFDETDRVYLEILCRMIVDATSGTHRWINRTEMNRTEIRSMAHPLFNQAWNLYKKSFPPEERRPLRMQKKMMNNPLYHFEVVTENGRFVGLILWWKFETVIYIEHLATSSHIRGRGYGGRILEEFVRRFTLPLLLEVEPPAVEINRRRIDFYRRFGFVLNEHAYRHPPYKKGGEYVSLMLMTYPEAISEEECRDFCEKYHPVIHKFVLKDTAMPARKDVEGRRRRGEKETSSGFVRRKRERRTGAY
jgi:GAF domain-containing protein